MMGKMNSLTNNSQEVPTLVTLMAGFNGGNVPFGGVAGVLPFIFSFGSLYNNVSKGARRASGSKRRRKAVKKGADVATGAGGAKAVKGVDDVADKQQRRKIKNRESAARSRERKLAYSIQLQIEINELKEENEFIKKAIKVLKTNLAMEPNKTEDGKSSLKRTFSGPF